MSVFPFHKACMLLIVSWFQIGQVVMCKPFYTIFMFLVPFRCGCEECTISRNEDSLRHSRSRINAYRALASPSLIALSSKDPILTAFELSWELRRLSFVEHEFKSEYLVSKGAMYK